MSEKVFYACLVLIALTMIGFVIFMIPKAAERDKKYDQCIVEYAREVPDLKTFCNSMSRV